MFKCDVTKEDDIVNLSQIVEKHFNKLGKISIRYLSKNEIKFFTLNFFDKNSYTVYEKNRQTLNIFCQISEK